MKEDFWKKAKKPIFVLAPMANVTDAAFRKVIAKYGKPDVIWTEFVSADGLCSKGKDKLLVDLEYSKIERPIIAQLFTGHPLAMKKASKLAADLGFDGIDINMGCPDRAVERQGGGAGMIKNPDGAIEVIKAAREGAKKKKGEVPVTVKTRIGYNKVDWDWIRMILSQKLPAVTFHLRTRKEMSDVPAHWELMPDILKIRDEVSPETIVIGNGDIASVEDGLEKINKYGGDGVMVGRGIFGKPWFFKDLEKLKSGKIISGGIASQYLNNNEIKRNLEIMLEHSKLFEKKFKGIKNFAIMRKHFKAYVSGWEGAKELRMKFMECEDARAVGRVVKEYLKTLE